MWSWRTLREKMYSLSNYSSLDQTCSTDLNCNTDVGTYLTCSCVKDDSALKYCPADYGDDEWKVDIAEKVFFLPKSNIYSLKPISQRLKAAMLSEDFLLTAIRCRPIKNCNPENFIYKIVPAHTTSSLSLKWPIKCLIACIPWLTHYFSLN